MMSDKKVSSKFWFEILAVVQGLCILIGTLMQFLTYISIMAIVTTYFSGYRGNLDIDFMIRWLCISCVALLTGVLISLSKKGLTNE